LALDFKEFRGFWFLDVIEYLGVAIPVAQEAFFDREPLFVDKWVKLNRLSIKY